jgi:hypothetical protein
MIVVSPTFQRASSDQYFPPISQEMGEKIPSGIIIAGSEQCHVATSIRRIILGTIRDSGAAS